MSKRQNEIATDNQLDMESSQRTQFDRRRAALPQPDFTHYQKINAYPGRQYLFVGHSYNVAEGHEEPSNEAKRKEAIAHFFNKDTQWIPVKQALESDAFDIVLSRFERDMLTRLPETALIGPAIDDHGHNLDQCFTIWRKEMRRQAATKA
jgi:hypothetical protein